jgi:hypothetical protein
LLSFIFRRLPFSNARYKNLDAIDFTAMSSSTQTISYSSSYEDETNTNNTTGGMLNVEIGRDDTLNDLVNLDCVNIEESIGFDYGQNFESESDTVLTTDSDERKWYLKLL